MKSLDDFCVDLLELACLLNNDILPKVPNQQERSQTKKLLHWAI